MKKLFALCLSLCMLFACTVTPAAAADESKDELAETGHVYATFQVTVNEDGVTIEDTDDASVQPRNKDLLSLNSTINSGYFRVSRGENVKIHMYFTSAVGTIRVYANKGTVALRQPGNLKAEWRGTGHHWAELFMNAEPGTYAVFLDGVYAGDGAVYTEP